MCNINISIIIVLSTNIMIITNYPIVGILIGFIVWLIMLESDQMGGIIFRKDSDGIFVFSPINIWNMLCAPFEYLYFWNMEFWIHNWIVVCVICILIEIAICQITKIYIK